MAWGTVSAGDAIQSAALHAPYYRARHERARFGADLATAPGFSSTPAAGDDLQRLNAESSIWRIQKNLPSGVWVTTQKWNGASYSAISSWDNESDIQLWEMGFGSGETAKPSPFGLYTADRGGFSRKVAREVATLASGGYISAEVGSITNGHKARCVAAGDGRVYERVAGAWVDAGDTAVPDQVTVYGVPAAGDVLHSTLFNETRAVLQVLVKIEKTAGWTADGTNNDLEASSGTFGTWAAAKADAATSFAGATAISSDVFPGQWARGTNAYDESLVAIRSKITIPTLQTQFGKDAQFYFYAQTTVISPVNNTWDDNGTGYHQDKWNLKETQSIVAGTGTGKSGFVGTLGQPNDPPDPVTSGDEGQGWEGYWGAGDGAPRVVEICTAFTDT